MPRNPSDSELKEEFSLRIRQLLTKGESARELSAVLGVKVQMVYNYRDAKNAPSPEVIHRLMENWPEITLTYRGKILSLQDFRRKRAATPKRSVQYELWDVLKKIDSKSVEIEILDRGEASLHVGLRISFRR